MIKCFYELPSLKNSMTRILCCPTDARSWKSYTSSVFSVYLFTFEARENIKEFHIYSSYARMEFRKFWGVRFRNTRNHKLNAVQQLLPSAVDEVVQVKQSGVNTEMTFNFLTLRIRINVMTMSSSVCVHGALFSENYQEKIFNFFATAYTLLCGWKYKPAMDFPGNFTEIDFFLIMFLIHLYKHNPVLLWYLWYQSLITSGKQCYLLYIFIY